MADDDGKTDDAAKGDDAKGDKAAAEKTFTQTELNQHIQERLARDRKERPSDDEIKELRDARERLSKIEDANKSELEKANAARDAAEKKSAEALATANARLIQAEVLAAATAAKAVKPEHLHKLIDTADVKVGDDGQVTGATEAVKAFLDANPEYVATRSSGDADQGARGNGADQLTRDALKTMSPDEIAKALDEGRLASLTGSK